MKIEIPQEMGPHETGCHTDIGNDLVLYAQATRRLYEQREKLFINMLSRKLNWSGCSEFNVMMALEQEGTPLLKSTIKAYEEEVLNRGKSYFQRTILKLNPQEAGDFIAWLVREFETWEMDKEPRQMA